jgi:hypothetical protein
MYYLGKIFTYKLDWTIVTAGALSMLAMSKSSFSRCLFFGFSCRRFLRSRGWDRFRPALSNRRLRFDFCHGGGRAAASFSWLPHCLPVTFIPLVYGVGRRNLPQATEFLSSAYTTLKDKYSTTLLEEFTS